MTMLMCGLLVPDEGEVLIDGHSVYEYNRDELYKMFSLFPRSIADAGFHCGKHCHCR